MKKFNFKKGITHGGVFHADEVAVTDAIRLLFNHGFKVNRTFRVPDEIPSDTFVYDIGNGDYDHHQKGGNGTRENGIPYASFGLFWRDFCPYSDFIKEQVDRNLVQGIDALDNGIQMPKGDCTVASISKVISTFNPNWDEEENTPDNAFERAVQFMIPVISNEIRSEQAKEKARDFVTVCYEERESRIVELPRFMPWQEYLLNLDPEGNVLYVIFPSNRGGYNIQCVPKELGSFETRKPFPEAWAGLRDTELQEVSGVKTATFCHNGRFMCAADTLEDAREMAKRAVEEVM